MGDTYGPHGEDPEFLDADVPDDYYEEDDADAEDDPDATNPKGFPPVTEYPQVPAGLLMQPPGQFPPPPGRKAPFPPPSFGPPTSRPGPSGPDRTLQMPAPGPDGKGDGPPRNRRQPPSGPGRKPDGGRRRRPVIPILLVVLFAIVAIGVYSANPFNILGRNTASSHPQASNSAGAAPTRLDTQPPSSANGQSASAGGIAAPSVSTPAQASAPSSTAPAAAGGPSVGAGAPNAQGGTVCTDTSGWNTDPQVAPQQVHLTAPVVARSPGIHGNCDRLVFIVKGNHPFKHGTKVGFTVGYTAGPLEGYPALRLVILAPSQLAVHNGYVVSPDLLQSLATQAGASFKELRWVKSAGTSAGQTQLVISVRDKHPFAAFTTVDSQGNLLVIVDVAAQAHGNAPSPAPSSS